MASQWRSYAIFLILTTFGLLVSLMGHGGSLEEVQRNAKELLASGRSVTAYVAKKWSGSDYQSVSYTYVVDGRTYNGLCDPGASNFVHWSAGTPFTVYYLPSNPSVSDYDPHHVVDSATSSRTASFAFVGVGLAGLIGTALYGFTRRNAATYDPMSAGEKTYRMTFIAFVVGMLFFIAGICVQVGIVQQFFSGAEMMMRVNGVLRTAGPGERVLMLLFPVIFWAVGLLLILYWKSYRIVVTPQSITAVGMFGSRNELPWSDIKQIRKKYLRGGFMYVLEGGFTRIKLVNTLTNFGELEQDLRAHLHPLFLASNL